MTLYIIALFSAKGWMGYAVMAVTLAACVKVSHVGLRALVRGLKPLVFIIAFTGILNTVSYTDVYKRQGQQYAHGSEIHAAGSGCHLLRRPADDPPGPDPALSLIHI